MSFDTDSAKVFDDIKSNNRKYPFIPFIRLVKVCLLFGAITIDCFYLIPSISNEFSVINFISTFPFFLKLIASLVISLVFYSFVNYTLMKRVYSKSNYDRALLVVFIVQIIIIVLTAVAIYLYNYHYKYFAVLSASISYILALLQIPISNIIRKVWDWSYSFIDKEIKNAEPE